MTVNFIDWYDHAKRIDRSRMLNKGFGNELIGVRRMCRPRKSCIDGGEEILGDRGMTVKQQESNVCEGWVYLVAWGEIKRHFSLFLFWC